MGNPFYTRHDGTRVEFTLSEGGSIPIYESPDAEGACIVSYTENLWEAYHISDPPIEGHGPTPQEALDSLCSKLRRHHDVAVAIGLLPPEPTPDVWEAARRWMSSGGDVESQVATAHAGAIDTTKGFVERSTHARNLLLLSAIGFHVGIWAYQRGDDFRDLMDDLLAKDKTRSWCGLFGDEHQIIIAADGEWVRAPTPEQRKAMVEEIMRLAGEWASFAYLDGEMLGVRGAYFDKKIEAEARFRAAVEKAFGVKP